MKRLNTIKARYLKRCLGAANVTNNTLISQMCEEQTTVEALITDGLSLRREEMQTYLEETEQRRRQLRTMKQMNGRRLDRKRATNLNDSLRSATNRTTLNGLHHLICKNEEKFHERVNTCSWKFYGGNAQDLDHFMTYKTIKDKAIVERVRTTENGFLMQSVSFLTLYVFA